LQGVVGGVVECCDVISDRVDGSHPRGVVGGTVKCYDVISAVTELMVSDVGICTTFSVTSSVQ